MPGQLSLELVEVVERRCGYPGDEALHRDAGLGVAFPESGLAARAPGRMGLRAF
jgi:hypothetical protein